MKNDKVVITLRVMNLRRPPADSRCGGAGRFGGRKLQIENCKLKIADSFRTHVRANFQFSIFNFQFAIPVRFRKARTPALWSVVLVAAILCLAPAARAQDDDDEVQPAQPQFIMPDENFDMWVFGNRGNAAAARTRLDSLLLLKIDSVEQNCNLAEGQRGKLILAGKGDIKRFFEHVEELRKKFQKLKTDQNRVNEIAQAARPFQTAVNSGPFGRGSFFEKALKNTLTAEQAAQYDEIDRRRHESIYRAKVELVLATVDRYLGLTSEQRKRLCDLVVEHSRAPLTFGQYDYYVVMFQASRIPAERFQAILDGPQWRVLSRIFDQVRGLGQFLQQQGLLDEEVQPAAK